MYIETVVSRLLRVAVICAAVLPMAACGVYSDLVIFDYYTPASAEDKQAILERARLFDARVETGKYGWKQFHTSKSYYVQLLLDDEMFLRFLVDDDFAWTVIEQLADADSATLHQELSINPINAVRLEKFARTISPGTGS